MQKIERARETDIILKDGGRISRAEFDRVLAECERKTAAFLALGPPVDIRTNRQELELRRKWIDQQARKLIEAGSCMQEDHTGQSAFKPWHIDLARAIGMLNDAVPDKPGSGRPRSPKVNRHHLRALRNEAGMSQAKFVEVVTAVLKETENRGFSAKTLQRYEQSEAADRENLEVIAAVLTERLSRSVSVEALTL